MHLGGLVQIISEVTLNHLEVPPRKEHEKCQLLLFQHL